MELGDLTTFASRDSRTTGLKLEEQGSKLFGLLLPLLALVGGAEVAKALGALGMARGGNHRGERTCICVCFGGLVL